MISKARMFLLIALLLLLSLPALADEAPVITDECSILTPSGYTRTQELRDGKTTTSYSMSKDIYVSVNSPDQDISGLLIQYSDRSSPMEVLVPDGDDWKTVWTGSDKYLTEWVSLPENTRQARVKNIGKSRAYIAELIVYGEGDKPRRAHEWKEPGKADIMLVVAHPDDELLWFGGLLPTYAGQRDLNVQVVYLVPTTPRRRLELLDGIWHCGVDTYPLFADLPDVRAENLKEQYRNWDKTKLLNKIVRMIRQVQPEIVITQEVNGEYGHTAHKVCADICQLAVESAVDPNNFPESADTYGAWQVKKLYIHLYDERQIRLDWHQPLSAFNGQDGLAVANEALQWHRSQHKNGWDMVEDGGEMDNALFGLAFSAVGDDQEKNDLMENIWID